MNTHLHALGAGLGGLGPWLGSVGRGWAGGAHPAARSLFRNEITNVDEQLAVLTSVHSRSDKNTRATHAT